MLKLLLAAWIVYGPSGPVARTIVENGGDCPAIVLDGHEAKMRTYTLPGTNYPVRVCESAIEPHVKSASIEGTALPVAKLHRNARVAILGDTGCRLKAGKTPQIQDCSDPKAWPFKEVADAVAAWDPDLILHVGDYYYREATCKSGKCTPSTYDWKRWDADFFQPAKKLLPHAPWVMARGNHETCSRAAEGWFRILDPRSYLWEDTKFCNSNLLFTPPYNLAIGDMHIAVMDSSGAADNLDPKQVPMWTNQLALVGKNPAGTWMMLHHPLWADSYNEEDSDTLAAAWQAAPLPSIGLVLSGHIHALEVRGFTGNETPQFVVGNGGTALDPAVGDATGKNLGGRTVASFYQDNDFGFIAATHKDGTWTFDIRTPDGKSKTVCTWTAGAAMTCVAAGS